MKILVTQKELGVEPLHIHFERGELKWLRHFFKCLLEACHGRYSEHVPLGEGTGEDARWAGGTLERFWPSMGFNDKSVKGSPSMSA